MKKLLFLLLLTIFPLASNAQRVDKPGEPYNYFCSIEIQFVKPSSKVKYGSSKVIFSFPKESCVLIDGNGVEIEIPEETFDLLDLELFMSKRGWTLKKVYDTYVSWRQMYSFVKEVTSDEQAKEGFHLKTISKKEPYSPLLDL